MYPVEQCPKCGSFTEGSPVYNNYRKATRAGTKYAVKKVIIYIATPLILTILGPLGTITGFIVAFFIVLYIDKKATEYTDSIDLDLYTSTPFEFHCPQCGNTWERTYEKGIDYTTDPVLEWQKNGLILVIRSEASSARVIAIIAGIICIPCALYCLSHLTNQSDYLVWWLLFIIGMPALCIAINQGVKSHNKNQEADELEDMPVSLFRNSGYRAGNPFVGKVVNIDDENEVIDNQQKALPLTKQPKLIAPITQEPIKQTETESLESIKNNLDNLTDLLQAGVLTSEEYAELEQIEKKKLLNNVISQQTGSVENNKIALLRSLKSLLDEEILSQEEYQSQKEKILWHESTPLCTEGKTTYETLLELKSLLDEGALTQKDFDCYKKLLLNAE